MPQLSEDSVLQSLKAVKDPVSGQDLVAAKMISGLVIKDGNVGFSIEIDPARAGEMEPLRKAAEASVLALDGVTSATAILTAHSKGATKAPPQAAKPQERPAGDAEIKSIVAVASGKGGVGKSTVATNLALALSRLGLKVGMLDADIYGPSQPRMLGMSGRPDSPDGKRLLPKTPHGIKAMSIGLLVKDDTPMIWRGPMVQSALQQMLRDVEWGPLDILIVDMPPGTGDAQLTMSQQVPLAGAIIVSTPQDIALLDARKGLNMFKKVEVPVLGFIENMSLFICPNCGHESHIFAHGGAKRAAEEMGVDFLGEIPLDLKLRETSDMGDPIVVAHPDSQPAKIFMAIAEKVAAKLGGGARKTAPQISIN